MLSCEEEHLVQFEDRYGKREIDVPSLPEMPYYSLNREREKKRKEREKRFLIRFRD